MYAGGDFTIMGGQERKRLAAVDVAGGAVLSWNPDASGAVFAVTAGGGQVYVAGNFAHVGGQRGPHFAAFTEDTPTPTLVSLANAQDFTDRVELTSMDPVALLYGEGGEADPETGKDWIRRAAAHGDPCALGFIEKNPDEIA